MYGYINPDAYTRPPQTHGRNFTPEAKFGLSDCVKPSVGNAKDYFSTLGRANNPMEARVAV